MGDDPARRRTGDEPSTRVGADGPPDDASIPWLSTWALPMGVLVVLGPLAPLGRGLGWPLLAVAVLTAITLRRSLVVHRWLRACGGWSAALSEASPLQRTVLVGLVAIAVVVFATVAARGVGSVVVAYPAALWGLAAAAVGAFVVALARGRARVPAALLCALLVPAAGVWGARYEAQGETAHGWAQSGPIHGIHPFQTTAIIVDDYGPFDLPLNDYVEPDGNRGYSPAELAEAIERALHRVADLHFADGPHRARKALLEAEVGHAVTAPIRERLDREPNESEHPRLWVRSGTWGQRSRVAFVCPGRRDGPADTRDDVMNRMCPDKYASEASAGLGVTGRWPGYAEGRGNEQLGLSRLFGWTRSDDAIGRRVVEREVRLWAWIVLVAAGAWTLLGRGRGAAAMRTVCGALAVLVVVVLVAMLGDVHPRVGWVEHAAGWTEPWGVRPWLAVLALGGGLWLLDRRAPRVDALAGPRWTVGPRVMAVAGVALGLTMCTVLVASHPLSTSWIVPRLWAGPDAGALAFETWIMHVADAIGPRGALDILEIESAVAAALAVALVGLVASMVAVVGDVAAHAWPAQRGGGSPSASLVVVGIVLLVAAGLVVSRKTEGAATLVHGAIGLTLVVGSGLSVLAHRHGPARPRSMAIPAGIHVAWCLLAVQMVLASARAAEAMHAFVLLCAAVGLVATVGGLALVAGKRPAAAAHRQVDAPPDSASDPVPDSGTASRGDDA